MARATHAAKIDLRFGNAARELAHFGISVWPSNLAGKRFGLCAEGLIGVNRQAQSMPKGVSG